MKRISCAVAIAAVVVTLSGCVNTSPVSKDAWGWETRDVLEAWVVEQTDAAIAASELAEGWREIGHDSPRSWSADRDAVIEGIETRSCYSGGDVRPHELMLDLVHDDPPHAFEAMARVREYWQSQGWQVGDLVPLDDEQSEDVQYVVARLEDGSALSIQGTELAVVLSVTSACSADISLENFRYP